MDITAKLWSYCHILRHDGVDYVDYIEQLTYLLFLKMAEESEISIPEDCNWNNLLKLEGENLKKKYESILQELKKQKGILGEIFQEPISKIQNPSSLKKIIDGIESIGWTKLEKDVQGEAFEGLLEKTANEGKKGAGQFFTPRPLIQAIVDVMRPDPTEVKNFVVGDTSCGTGGFLTMALEWARKNVSPNQIKKESNISYFGQELVVRPYRLALMNMFLHGVKAEVKLGDSIYNTESQKENLNCILTNPPFGTRGSVGPPDRNFPVITSNLQLNFIQHIYELLKDGGRAAIVLPDSSLSDTKAKELWRLLIGNELCNVHTILRLPNGTFNPYANGVKACVIFLQKGKKTENVWVYDARSGVEDITKASRPLDYEKHFGDFVKSYGIQPNGSSKRVETTNFKRHTLKEIKEKNYDLSTTQIYQPQKLEEPVFYIDKLIVNFEQQLNDLKTLKEILQQKVND